MSRDSWDHVDELRRKAMFWSKVSIISACIALIFIVLAFILRVT